MKVSDVVTLLKSGYSKDEIAEMVKAEKGPEPKPEPNPEPEPEPKPEPKPEPEPEPKPDEKDAEIEKLKAQLAAAQAANVNKDNSGNTKSDEDILSALVADFI